MLAALTRTVRHISEPGEPEMPPVAPRQVTRTGPCWSRRRADSRLAKTLSQPVRLVHLDLSDEHELPKTTPKPTFTLGLDQ